MMDGFGGAQRSVLMTLYTDAFVVKGRLETRHGRITDALNEATDGFLVLSDVTFDEYRSTATMVRADYAQVNLGSVLFAVSDEPPMSDPDQVTPRVTEVALITIPPFRVTGRIHLQPEQALRDALGQLHGDFVPVTDATYWSDPLGEARTTVALVAVNHARCQILAPHQEIDPWAGLATGPAEAGADAGSGSTAPQPPEKLGW